MDSVNDLYEKLKKEKEDYVFLEDDLEIVRRLAPYCPSNQETLFWFLGGPLLWIFKWRSANKIYKEDNISKIEQKIISILSRYHCSFKDDYCLLIRKEL